MKFIKIQGQDIWINSDLIANVVVKRDAQENIVASTIQFSGVSTPVFLGGDETIALLNDLRGI